jgi:hypothetical protein
MDTADQSQKKSRKKDTPAEFQAPGTPVSEPHSEQELKKIAQDEKELIQAKAQGLFRERGGSKAAKKATEIAKPDDHIDALVKAEIEADHSREVVDLFQRIEDVTVRHAELAKQNGHHGVACDLNALRDVARQAAKRTLGTRYTTPKVQ